MAVQDLRSKKYATIPVRPDYEVRLNEVHIEGQVFLDIREFIPSLNSEGKGLLINHDAIPQLIEELTRYGTFHGVVARDVTPGPGQGKLDL